LVMQDGIPGHRTGNALAFATDREPWLVHPISEVLDNRVGVEPILGRR